MAQFTQGGLGAQNSDTLFMHALEQLDAGKLEVLRPELKYPVTFPLESWRTNVRPGMEYLSKIFIDWQGRAQMLSREGIDFPMMGVRSNKLTVQIFEYAIGNTLSTKTLQQGEILAEKGFSEDPRTYMPQIANAAIKEAYERILLFGDTIQDGAGSQYPGFLNFPGIDILSATGAWATLDAEQLIDNIRRLLIAPIENSKLVHKTSTLLLPIEQYALISYKKAGTRGNDETVLKYIKGQGMAAELNGADIEVIPYVYLEDGGGTGINRAIAYEKNARNFMIGNPIDFQVQKVIETLNGFDYKYNGEISNLQINYPTAIAYMDDI